MRRSTISRRHASVSFRKDHYELNDLSSSNGTFVNARRISGPVTIVFGDEIRFGDAGFIFTKPLGATPPYPGLRRILTFRGAIEIALVAFVIGFAASQYLAYLLYHEQNRLILAEAVPLKPAPEMSASAKATEQPLKATSSQARAQPSRTPAQVRIGGSPAPESVEKTAPTPLLSPRSRPAGPNELAAGIALARLFRGSGTEAGRLAPDFTLPGLDGSGVSLDATRGKAVFLNFWATWCPACRSEMPSLQALYRDFSSYHDFTMVTVCINSGSKSAVASFIARSGYDFPVLLDNENVTGTAYRVRGIPSTFIIAPDGRIVWNFTGALNWSSPEIRDAIKKLL